LFGQCHVLREEADEVAPGLMMSCPQAGQNLPTAPSAVGLIAAGELPSDDRRAQGPLGAVVGRLDPHILQVNALTWKLWQQFQNSWMKLIDYCDYHQWRNEASYASRRRKRQNLDSS